MENLQNYEEQVEQAVQQKDYVGMWCGDTTDVVGKDWCSLKVETKEEKKELVSLITGDVLKLQEHVNETLTIYGVYLENVVINDSQTGEQRLMPRMLLLAEEGVYSTCGITAFNALSKIMKHLGMPSKDEPLKLKIKMSSNNGKQFYSFQVI